MRFEHFLYGAFNGVGIRLVKSPGVDQILSRKSLTYLLRLDGESPIQTLTPENYVAVTYLRNDKDEYDRRTTWNHTILVPMRDFFTLNPPTMFNPYFISELSEPPVSLKPLKVKTS